LLLGVSALCAFVALSKGRSTCWAPHSPLESPRQHDDEHHHGVHGGSPPMQRAIFMEDRDTGFWSASGGSANLGLSRLARSQLGDLRVVGRDDALVIMPCVVTEAPARVQCEVALQSRIGRNSLGTSISSRGVGRGRSRPEATAPRNNAGPGGAPVMPPVAGRRSSPAELGWITLGDVFRLLVWSEAGLKYQQRRRELVCPPLSGPPPSPR
jgi:hypothetical protein